MLIRLNAPAPSHTVPYARMTPSETWTGAIKGVRAQGALPGRRRTSEQVPVPEVPRAAPMHAPTT